MTAACATDQVKQVRGFADQQLRKPEDPDNTSNRRISVIVKYLKGAGGAKTEAAHAEKSALSRGRSKRGLDASGISVQIDMQPGAGNPSRLQISASHAPRSRSLSQAYRYCGCCWIKEASHVAGERLDPSDRKRS